MSPKVSIVIPVYNVEKYLKCCLDSIINQTLNEIEIICVNDGSTDSSGQILEEYAQKDNRIKIVNKENGGLSSARNEGLKYVTTEYVGFVDSDDWIEPETYEYALSKMKDDIDIVCYGAKVAVDDGVDKNAKEIQDAIKYHKIKFVGEFKLNDDVIIKGSTCTSWNKLHRMSIIKEHNLVFPNGLLLEDNLFFYSYMLMSKKACYVNKYFYNYRQRANSIMSEICDKKSKLKINGLLVCYEIFKFLNNNNLINQHAELFIRIFQNLFNFDYANCAEENKMKVVDYAVDFASKMDRESKHSEVLLKKLRIALYIMFANDQSPNFYIDF